MQHISSPQAVINADRQQERPPIENAPWHFYWISHRQKGQLRWWVGWADSWRNACPPSKLPLQREPCPLCGLAHVGGIIVWQSGDDAGAFLQEGKKIFTGGKMIVQCVCVLVLLHGFGHCVITCKSGLCSIIWRCAESKSKKLHPKIKTTENDAKRLAARICQSQFGRFTLLKRETLFSSQLGQSVSM